MDKTPESINLENLLARIDCDVDRLQSETNQIRSAVDRIAGQQPPADAESVGLKEVGDSSVLTRLDRAAVTFNRLIRDLAHERVRLEAAIERPERAAVLATDDVA
ncbi:hypothetical protein OOZ53_11265 [Hoeflea sp. E7-10]|uniref:Uncharacterized protein n=1 Tax=Hoeflea poritis TaxID=2993659 RepID=A0ABT4VMI5_9HYPH|nr:hypothetical protein [Hoeflea poritis]